MPLTLSDRETNLKRSNAIRYLSRRTYSPPMVSHDPLIVLGSDVFHDILQCLQVKELLVAEQVCSSWAFFSRTNSALWRNACRREKLDPCDIAQRDATERKKNRQPGDVTPWRELCLTLLPMQRAWADGRAHFRSIPYPSGQELPRVAFVAPGYFVVSGANVLALNTFTRNLDLITGIPTYHHMEAWGGFLVGMYTSNQVDTVAPKPVPTRIEVWRVIRPTRPGAGWFHYVTALTHPPVWGYALRLYMDVVPAPHLVVAVLAGGTKISGTHPHDHWTSVRNQRAIHLWHIDCNGLKPPHHQKIVFGDVGFVKSFELDNDYVFVPSHTDLHIYSRHNGRHIVIIPSPPQDVALAFRLEPHTAFAHPIHRLFDFRLPLPVTHVATAGATTTDPLYWDAMALAHIRPLERRREEYAKCRTTRRDLVVTSPAGALFILRNYRSVLRGLTQLPSEQRLLATGNHTILIATGYPIDDIATHGDRIAFRMSRKRETMVTIDANALPDLPHIQAQEKEQANVDAPGVRRPSPRLFARILSGHSHRDKPIQDGMYMDGTGVYYPANLSVKAHFFGSIRGF